jgi:hypothetical protein
MGLCRVFVGPTLQCSKSGRDLSVDPPEAPRYASHIHLGICRGQFGRGRPSRRINSFAMEINVFPAFQAMRSSDPNNALFRTVMAPTQRRTPGLLLRHGIWHIDKIIYGKRICESTGTGDRIEAEALLARRVTQARHVHLFGELCEHSFREAAAKFLAENQHKRSLERDQRALAVLDPFIGSLPLQRVHHDTLAPYIRSRHFDLRHSTRLREKRARPLRRAKSDCPIRDRELPGQAF